MRPRWRARSSRSSRAKALNESILRAFSRPPGRWRLPASGPSKAPQVPAPHIAAPPSAACAANLGKAFSRRNPGE
jgi:hypothetical protein